ncbi:alpha/beta fold hydrolase [Streptomyces sp. NPDC056730]|uniref:alpha/beta fold hydrolase n=2 Tax=Streptomyces TaxID=1883 RepID=UPI0036695915
MSTIERAGARLSCTVDGDGEAVLLLAAGPTGLPEPDPAAAAAHLRAAFRVIAPRPRHTGGGGVAPLEPFSYAQAAADQLAVLDALGVGRVHVVALGSACAQAWRLVREAPERVRRVVCVEPAGLEGPAMPGALHAPFDEAMRTVRARGAAGVLDLAEREGDFARAAGAGPFAGTLRASVESRAELSRLSVERHVVLLGRYRDGLWPAGSPYFSVTEEWMRRIPTPLSVVPGSGPSRPEGFAGRLVRNAPDARLSGAEPGGAAAFLTEHSAR